MVELPKVSGCNHHILVSMSNSNWVHFSQSHHVEIPLNDTVFSLSHSKPFTCRRKIFLKLPVQRSQLPELTCIVSLVANPSVGSGQTNCLCCVNYHLFVCLFAHSREHKTLKEQATRFSCISLMVCCTVNMSNVLKLNVRQKWNWHTIYNMNISTKH